MANVLPLLALVAQVPTPTAAWSLHGYVEAYYQFHTARPSNGQTAFRGFDDRSESFTIANAALDGQWDDGTAIGRLTLQVGATGATYYLAEPSFPGSASVAATDAGLWRYIQQAYAGFHVPFARELTVEAGVFLSPVGPESMAVRDDWNWSRSNLFFGLPFYHTGGRFTYALDERLTLIVGVYNGWNSVIDDNRDKSVSLQVVYTVPNTLVLSLLYFGGNERPTAAPEGSPWRNTGDLHATVTLTAWLSLLGHVDVGAESTRFGVSSWIAGALYVRAQATEWLSFSARGDAFYEHAAESERGAAARIFWPADWVSSGTVSVEVRPIERAKLLVEYRHDRSAAEIYFGGNVSGDGLAEPFVPNRRGQSTLTVGATTWF